MSEGNVPASPDGRHVHPWYCPVRPRVEKRSVPASRQSLQRVGGMARAPGGHKPKLLDQVRGAIRMRHYSVRTEEAYVSWIKRFILFHGKRHPLGMGEAEITQFLSALAVRGQVSASTQDQALCALVFLYRHVLDQNLGWLEDIVRAKRPQRLPVVLTRPEVKVLLGALEGVHWIMASLLYRIFQENRDRFWWVTCCKLIMFALRNQRLYCGYLYVPPRNNIRQSDGSLGQQMLAEWARLWDSLNAEVVSDTDLDGTD